jgi:hypothetical protein
VTVRVVRRASKMCDGPLVITLETAASHASRRAVSPETVQPVQPGGVGAVLVQERAQVNDDGDVGADPPAAGRSSRSRARRASSTSASALRCSGVRSSSAPWGAHNGASAMSTVSVPS